MRYEIRSAEFVAIATLSVSVMAIVRPNLFADPRFFAEEATLYFSGALQHGAGSLLQVHNASFLLLTNVMTWAATLVELRLAPFVTTYSSAALMSLVTAQFYALARTYERPRSIAILAPLAWLLLPTQWEAWLTATNVQWLCAVSVLLALCNPPTQRTGRYICVGWFVICGLTGVPSAMLAPVALVAALASRSRFVGLLSLVLIACAFTQIAVIALAGTSGRDFSIDVPTLLVPLFSQSVYVSLLGKIATWQTVGALAGDIWLSAAFIAVGATAIGLLVVISVNRRVAAILCTAMLLTGIIQTLGALGGDEVRYSMMFPGLASRYFATASACFIALLALNKCRDLAIAALSLSIAMSAYALGREPFEVGPSWHDQIENCSTQVCSVETWPTGWFVQISP